jgi:hypothetical protein
MSTRPSRGGGFNAAIPSFEDPHVFLWAPTEDVVDDRANREYLPVAVRLEGERARLEREFSAQQWAEYLRIRERA